MTRTFIALCDNLLVNQEDFVKYFSGRVYADHADTAVLVGSRDVLNLIKPIRNYFKNEFSLEINLNVLILQDLNDADYLFERFKYKIMEFQDSEILINIIHGSSKVSAIAIVISKLYGLKIQDKVKIEDISIFKNFDVVDQMHNSDRPMYYVKRLFNNYDFKLAQEVLEDNYTSIDITERMFYTIIDIYKKWDGFEYDQYDFEKIESYFSNLEELPRNKKGISIILDKNNKSHNTYKIADMINNAARRIEEERYDDAIIRLYRALELIGEAELYEKYGMRKDNIRLEDIDNLNIDKRSIINIKRRLDFKYPRYQIPLTTTFYILQKLYDDVGLYYSKNREKYQELFQKRNVSVLVHGEYKYEPDEIKEMLEKVTDLAMVYDKFMKRAIMNLKFPKFNI